MVSLVIHSPLSLFKNRMCTLRGPLKICTYDPSIKWYGGGFPLEVCLERAHRFLFDKIFEIEIVLFARFHVGYTIRRSSRSSCSNWEA